MVAAVLIAVAGWLALGVVLLLHRGHVRDLRDEQRRVVEQMELQLVTARGRIERLEAVADAYRTEGLKNPAVLTPAAPVDGDLRPLPSAYEGFLAGFEDPAEAMEYEAAIRDRIAREPDAVPEVVLGSLVP